MRRRLGCLRARRRPEWTLLVLMALGSLLLVPRDAAVNRAFRQVVGFGSNPGALNMWLYTPGRLPRGRRPLVVALHGCQGSAAQFRGTGWEAAAWRGKFHVLYVEQRVENSPGHCFNHFRENEPQKGAAEVRSILQMIDFVRRRHPIAPKQIYLTGFSSGGQMAMVLGARYPQRFAAISVIGAGSVLCPAGHKGIPGFAYCHNNEVRLPSRWNRRRGRQPHRPRIAIWHGQHDKNVDPQRVNESVRHWTRFHGIDERADRVVRWPRGVERREYQDRRRRTMVQTVMFADMAHTIPVRPPGCGRIADEYFSEEALCFAWESARFFGLIQPQRRRVPRKRVRIPVQGRANDPVRLRSGRPRPSNANCIVNALARAVT